MTKFRTRDPALRQARQGRRGWRDALLALLGAATVGPAHAGAYIPASEAQILAEVPVGAHHADVSVRRLAQGRLDVALPLAQFYIGQARTTGDLRFLGYAEAVLGPWVGRESPDPSALVYRATIEQSRHDFDKALRTLDRALRLRRDDSQAWLTRATVLRVQGRYDEASDACEKFAAGADEVSALICSQGVLALQGGLVAAYAALARLPVQTMAAPERAWRDSELGEMATRLGDDRAAERWFASSLASNRNDFYVLGAYADLLLRGHRPAAVLELLHGKDSIEPLLLRIAIAQKQLRNPGLRDSRARLAAAFAAESARGESIHRREQARYLLQIESKPREALAAALLNWQVQREPDDGLVLVAAAQASGSPEVAVPAVKVLHGQGLRDDLIAHALQDTP
jgi:tetratricopeptide (TPR) repeat protein